RGFDFGSASISGSITYGRRGLPTALAADGQPIITDVRYTADGLTERVTYGDSVGGTRPPTVEETEYDIRRRPVRSRVTRMANFDSVPGTLQAVNRIVDQELVWDVANNLVALVDDRDPAEWPAGFRPQSVHVEHDSLYRVVAAHFDYTQEDGSRAGDDVATDYRDTMATVRPMDPMRTRPAPMLPAQPANRVSALEWRYDWLANMTAWREPERADDGTSFYERELGTIANGSAEPQGRPSALRLATNLNASASGSDRGGWLSVDYGDSGNVVALTVRAQCQDAGGDVCQDLGDDETTTDRRAYLLGHCTCAAEQHYQYRWDELNRLVEARRYDRGGSGDWSFAVRQRYRYDAANQRVVKETSEPDAIERIALYPFPGDLERRGLERSVAEDAYVQGDVTVEDQFVVGGARFVRRFAAPDEGGLDPANRATIAITDLIGSTNAVIDLRSGALVETSTFYPNGATETYRALVEDEATGPDFAPREPMGFTGKEADEEVGLVYFGERYLIPRIGRWATPDPLHVHAMGGGEALNSYHYVSGNLLQSRDPLGLEVGDMLDAVVPGLLAGYDALLGPAAIVRDRLTQAERAARGGRLLEAGRHLAVVGGVVAAPYVVLPALQAQAILADAERAAVDPNPRATWTEAQLAGHEGDADYVATREVVSTTVQVLGGAALGRVAGPTPASARPGSQSTGLRVRSGVRAGGGGSGGRASGGRRAGSTRQAAAAGPPSAAPAPASGGGTGAPATSPSAPSPPPAPSTPTSPSRVFIATEDGIVLPPNVDHNLVPTSPRECPIGC
ncbi:MAG: RHS repeat-associated core domain-containing protein, partial [Deltaproteobacteria bacterium]|nr:RHS repeat-associated core domain-containing protein [Deltaproteobacteria bacterium]